MTPAPAGEADEAFTSRGGTAVNDPNGPPMTMLPRGASALRRISAGVLLKWAALAAAVVVTFTAVTRLASAGELAGIVVACTIAIAVVAVYGPRRGVPMKYLLPGVVLLCALQVWPVCYTVYTAFTNYSDGHRISKQEAVRAIVANSVKEVPDSRRYKLAVAVPGGQDPETGEVVYLLTDPDGGVFAGDLSGLHNVEASSVTKSQTGRVTEAEGYTLLTPAQVNDRSTELRDFSVPVGDDAGIKKIGLSEAYEGRATVRYNAATDTLLDTNTGVTYAPRHGSFVATDGSGKSFPQGWTVHVGLDNFSRVVRDGHLRAGFLRIFAWNVAFAALSVVTTFILGLLLALAFNHERMRGRGLYRAFLILPYAMPGFVTALVWASMYNRDYGLINNITGLHIDWLGNAWWAKVAILLANLWLGFPYMFLVCTGALQSLSAELKEAARIDGASPWVTLRSVTLPLLLVSVAPLLLASFAFNFNNFGLIYLLTGGGPFPADNPTAGGTDLLITYAFRLAFGGAGQQFGFASAISIFIFAIVALLSVRGFRKTRVFEEVHG